MTVKSTAAGSKKRPAKASKANKVRFVAPQPNEAAPKVALVGRPNVGKSTLFNKLVRRRLALVFDRPGVTRDRMFAPFVLPQPASELEHAAWLMDTAGLGVRGDDLLGGLSEAQTKVAVAESDFALLVVDGRAGLHPGDLAAAKLLRRGGRAFAVVVNKVDVGATELATAEFYRLGAAVVLATSAEHALGIDELRIAIGQALLAQGLLSEATRHVVGGPDADTTVAADPQDDLAVDAATVPRAPDAHSALCAH